MAMELPSTSSTATQQKTIVLAAIALFLAAAYSGSLGNSFHFDDRYVILQDHAITDAVNIPSIMAEVFNRPVLRITFALNHLVSGLDVWSYHALNIALHTAASFLAFMLAGMLHVRLMPACEDEDSKTLFQLVTSGLFALHPVHTGSVTYIASRSSVLSAVFFLLSFIFFLKTMDKTGREKTAYYVLSAAALLLGLGVKETVIIMPLLAVVFILVRPGGSGIRGIFSGSAAPFLAPFAAAAAYAAIKLASTGAVVPVDARIYEGVSPPYEYFLTELKVVAFYYSKWLAFPFTGPEVDPDIPVEKTLFAAAPMASGAAIAALILIAFALRKSRPLFSFGVFWYFITLIPTSSIFPLGDTAVERHIYLPSIGVFMAAAAILVPAFKERKKLLAAALAAAAFVFTYFTFERNLVWKDELTLWAHAARKTPEKIRPVNNLAMALMNAGRLDEAAAWYSRLLKVHPEYHIGHHNYAAALERAGKTAAAIAEYKEAARLSPTEERFYTMELARAYERTGLFKEAIDTYSLAIKAYGEDSSTLTSLASALSKAGRHGEAIAACEKALSLDAKNSLAAYIAGYSLEMTGNRVGAAGFYKTALALSPSWDLPAKRLAGLMKSDVEKGL